MSRYAQIVVHAGLSKTGTTSIQANCEKYSEHLRHCGVIYPGFSFEGEPLVTHSIPLTAAITGSPGKYGLRLRQRYGDSADRVVASCREQMDQVLRAGQGETLLLSTELIEGFDDEDMATLQRYLSAHTDTLRVVAYIRSPLSTLESLLQERTKAGALVEPAALVGRVRQKVGNLQRNIPAGLELVSFHQALQHPGGLVGSFLSLLGISQQALQGLEFVSRNERLAMEAFTLMTAINRRYSRREQEIHKVARAPGDLDALLQLPGPPFQLADFHGSAVQKACEEEAAWLEERLDFQFPQELRAQSAAQWQGPTLDALEQCIGQLSSREFRYCAAQCLREEAQVIGGSSPDNASRLQVVATRLLAGNSAE